MQGYKLTHITYTTSSYPGWIKSPHVVTLSILKLSDLDSLTIFIWWGVGGFPEYTLVIPNLKFSKLGWAGGYSRVNFDHPKSEVFRKGGGAFWSSIPERGFLENLDQNLLFSQKPACASQ